MKLLNWLTPICLVIGTLADAPAPAADAGSQTLDLKPIVNMDWRDEIWGDGKGGWTDQGDNDLRQVQVGRSTLLGIPFELRPTAARRSWSRRGTTGP
jgi:hypothetical protein